MVQPGHPIAWYNRRMGIFTKSFWVASAERALKSGAQFALLLLGTGAIAGGVGGESAEVINAFALNYITIAGAFAGGVIVSVLTSVISAPISGSGPSLANEVALKP